LAAGLLNKLEIFGKNAKEIYLKAQNFARRMAAIL
jgi:hypothetical protein